MMFELIAKDYLHRINAQKIIQDCINYALRPLALLLSLGCKIIFHQHRVQEYTHKSYSIRTHSLVTYFASIAKGKPKKKQVAWNSDRKKGEQNCKLRKEHVSFRFGF